MTVILWLHRYVGVAVGLLMVLWCLSGFVMMYQGWPDVTAAERIQGLSPLGPVERRDLSAIPIADDAALTSFRVEALDGVPVLRTPRGAFDLRNGAPVAVDVQAARAAASRFARAQGYRGAPDAGAKTGFDQWTIQNRAAAPFWRFRFDGADHAVVYVSAGGGEVVQATTGRERFWTWLGAIPHWLYPTVLRQHSGTWFKVVVWTSAVGTFLTVTGLYIGIARFRRRPNGRWSPYRKLFLWHHYTGLAFGVLALTWVFSGLLTMGPFGPMQSRPFPEAAAVNAAPDWAQARALIDAALARPDAAGMVQIESAPLAGGAFALAHYQDGRMRRLDVSGSDASLDEAGMRVALESTGGALSGAGLELMQAEDAYYYGHHATVDLPVWRVRTAENPARLLYLSARSGRTLRAYDGGAKAQRWLESGLHTFDFPGLRARPVWDVVVLPLLGGVTLLCIIGVWLGWERVRRDFRMLTRRRGRASGRRAL